MKLLFIGDVIGKPGRRIVQHLLPQIRKAYGVDFAVANVENAAGGFGLTPPVAKELLEAGIDVMTSGNHIWDKKDILDFLQSSPFILRPANYPPGAPGRGMFIGSVSNSPVVAVINLQGRVFMPPIDCPFRAADALLQEALQKTRIVLIDFHAEATSEKICLSRYVDGRASAVLGTHTHVQTADEQILPQRTAYLTDVGMTGPHDSVIGVEYDSSVQRFLLQIPRKYATAEKDSRLHAVLVEVENESGRAISIRRFSLKESWRPEMVEK
jgi:2',3'-cyclic-nucleotide 2'-phosphodiesterase